MSSHFYVITVQGPSQQVMTISGTATLDPDETREDLYTEIYAQAEADSGLNDPAVLFWSLEPNRLGGAA
jgi:hypothetical protein